MGIVIDIIIILFILASAFFGYKKGLISLAINILAFIIAMVVTLLLYKPIGNIIINNTTVDEKLQQMIQTKIEEFMKNDDSKDSSSKLIESAKNGLLPDTSKSLSINIIYGITLIVLFIIIKICLLLVNSLANQVAKFPIIKQFNEIGGVLYGLLRGIIITYVILMVIQLVVILNPNGALDNAMQESYLAKTMSTYNIFNVFFKT